MRKIIPAILLLCASAAMAQPSPFNVSRNARQFIYASYSYGELIDTLYTTVSISSGHEYHVAPTSRRDSDNTADPFSRNDYIKGFSLQELFVDECSDTITLLTTIFDGPQHEQYRTTMPYSRKDIAFDTDYVDGLTRYTCFINSNRLEFYFQPLEKNRHHSPGRQSESRSISPVPQYGRFPGLLNSFWRNGQCQLQLVRTDRKEGIMHVLPTDAPLVSSRQLSNIKREKMVIATPVFDSTQLCWRGNGNHIDGDYRQNTPFDSVLHFAGGTLALKRLRMPFLPAHYQTFVELRQRSNGDAYDRTGSVFIIPNAEKPLHPTFFDGINGHPDSLPTFKSRDGERYQGILPGKSPLPRYAASPFEYAPPVELMRFFTPFGVGHFNNRVAIDGLEWEDETYYKQDVTELASLLQGEVWIGIWIGNYDSGGHIVSLDIKSYPGDTDISVDTAHATPPTSLFNTCNVLEMAGQNYGKLFAADSLKVEFLVHDSNTRYRLRYIATGHGGWGGGDEFNPKEHTILIDNRPAFVHTPWRSDCGRYREWNPVSGNFWNGLSSSDFSRSGWCPGTATQPVYFSLPRLAPGKHTITVAIPQGAPQAGSFSHWCVSGILLPE